jgi:hypothetical protein
VFSCAREITTVGLMNEPCTIVFPRRAASASAMKLTAPSSSSPRVPANARRGAAQLMFYTAAQEEDEKKDESQEVAVFGGAVVADEQLEAAATPALDSVRACARPAAARRRRHTSCSLPSHNASGRRERAHKTASVVAFR